jgi:hypothetical protein
MKNIVLALLVSNILFISCYRKNLNCSNCYDRKTVLEAVNRLAEKRLHDRIENYQIETKEDQNSFVITYIDKEVLRGLKLGGGVFFKIYKKDCKITDYKRFK